LCNSLRLLSQGIPASHVSKDIRQHLSHIIFIIDDQYVESLNVVGRSTN
jgi:hypothetical protein